MSETRDAALVRNVIAILRSLDWGDVADQTFEEWIELRDDPHRAFLRAGDEQRATLWAAVQRRLPERLRETVPA